MAHDSTIRPAGSRHDTAEFDLPLDTPPMEARLMRSLPASGRWQYEPKWDGFRCLVFKAGAKVELRAKSGKPLGRYFPEVVAWLRTVPMGRFVVDCELLIGIEGRYDFDALQMRLHPAQSRIEKLAAKTPAQLMAFDMLVDTISTRHDPAALASGQVAASVHAGTDPGAARYLHPRHPLLVE
jgi:ATP-dependent DNA ligase